MREPGRLVFPERPEEPQHRMVPFDLMSYSFRKASATENAKSRTWLNMPVSIGFVIKCKLPNFKE